MKLAGLLSVLTVSLGAQSAARVDTLFARAFRAETHSAYRQQVLDSILQIDPRNDYAWQQKAMPLYKRKKYEIAAPFLDSAVKYNATRWRSYRGFMKCTFEKNYHAALGDLRLCEAKDPGGFVMDHSYDFYSGLCHLQLNRFDSARHYISRSISSGMKRAGEGHFFEYLYLGIVEMERFNYDDALKAFDLAIKGYPQFSDAWYYRSKCLEKLGRNTQAAESLSQARQFFAKGYTNTEDNAIYEEYPYQLKRGWLSAH